MARWGQILKDATTQILPANLQRDRARIATRRVSADDGRGEEFRAIQ
jgi:hypothetical protein